MNRECNNRVRNGQYRVWGVPKNIYNLGMIFSAFCLDTMLPKGSAVTEKFCKMRDSISIKISYGLSKMFFSQR